MKLINHDNPNTYQFQRGKESLRIAFKKISVSKATCPVSVLETLQLDGWETPVIKSSNKILTID